MAEITLNLPDELVKTARELDIPTDETITRLLRDEVERQTAQQMLTNAPGITKFHRHCQLPSPPMELFPHCACMLLHDHWKEATSENVIVWIKRLLSTECGQGDFFLMAESLPNALCWARVTLSSSYEWVELLWKPPYGIYLMPADLTYFVEVITEETVPRIYKTNK
jgi:hypothetical protein